MERHLQLKNHRHLTSNTKNTSTAPIDVSLGLGIFFSSLIEGSFKNHVVMFSDKSKMKKLRGSFCDKVDQLERSSIAWGGTNFQSVIDEIVRVRKQNPNIPIEDYPKILLVCSDMQFNPTDDQSTNYEKAMQKLESVGLPRITIIWWNLNGYGNDVPSTIDDEGTVLISGFDGSIVSSILYNEEVKDEETGVKRKANPYEQMVGALDQEVLNMIKV